MVLQSHLPKRHDYCWSQTWKPCSQQCGLRNCQFGPWACRRAGTRSFPSTEQEGQSDRSMSLEKSLFSSEKEDRHPRLFTLR
eukprot:1693110-Rhodomonas_salina.1